MIGKSCADVVREIFRRSLLPVMLLKLEILKSIDDIFGYLCREIPYCEILYRITN